MLSSIASILNSTLEIALVIVIVLISLYKSYLKGLRSALGLGIIGAFISAILIIYRVNYFGDREIFEGYLSFISSISAVLFLLWSWFNIRKTKEESNLEYKKGTILKGLFVFIISWVLVLGKTIDVILYPNTIFVMANNFLNTDLILKISGAIIGLLLALIFGITMLRTEKRITRKVFLTFSIAIFSVMIFRQLIMVLQILFATGILPLTSWALNIIAPLINSYYPMFFYLLIGMVVILWGQISHKIKNTPPDFSTAKNPAMKRKILAGFNREKRWVMAVGITVFFVIVILGSNLALANRGNKIEPPTPVTAQNGLINIELEKVNDGKLHRFSYLTSNNIETRFIIIKKGDNLYGTGLDACDICGKAGYFQNGKEVFCKNCNVAINIPTIGFPGGCNPIPLKNKKDDKFIIINTKDLEAKQDIFNK